MRRTLRPLSPAERAELEAPAFEPPEPVVSSTIFGALGFLLGAIIAGLGVAGIATLHYHGPAARIVLLIISLIFIAIGGASALWGLRVWFKALRRRPRLTRPARDLSAATADIIEFEVARAWAIDTGDEDSPPPLLIEQPNATFLLLTGEEVDALLFQDEDQLTRSLRRHARIEIFDNHILSAHSHAEPATLLNISAPDWFEDPPDLPADYTELLFKDLPPRLRRLIRTDHPTPPPPPH